MKKSDKDFLMPYPEGRTLLEMKQEEIIQTGKDWDQDFDRGSVPMVCHKDGCKYPAPHYHCIVCEGQVNSDEMARDFHPCCSLECLKAYQNKEAQ